MQIDFFWKKKKKLKKLYEKFYQNGEKILKLHEKYKFTFKDGK